MEVDPGEQSGKQAEQIKFSLEYRRGGGLIVQGCEKSQFGVRSSLHGDERAGKRYFLAFAASLVRASHMAIKLYEKAKMKLWGGVRE